MHSNTLPPISSAIFRAYDIRGLVGSELNTDVCEIIGRGIGAMVREHHQTDVVVGRDHRATSPELQAAVMRGLIHSGCHVVDIGQVATPVLYFASHHLSIPNAVMITASHNPPEYNGLKLMVNGVCLSQTVLSALYQRICEQRFVTGTGSLRQASVMDGYCERVQSDVVLSRPMKVVLDCGHGVAGVIAPRLLRQWGCEVIELYCEPDSRFPCHQPDPSQAENLQDLILKVQQTQADVGIALDGDGDRIGVVTNEGEIIWPDRLLMFFARDVLAVSPGTSIVYDVKSSRHLAEWITALGGQPVMWRTGHSFIKSKMKETHAVLGGEMSGHLFFADRWYGFDDGLYAAVRLLEILSKDHRTSNEIFRTDIPNSVSTSELKISIHETKKFKFIEQFIKQATFEKSAERITLDGLRVNFSQGWGLIRASNTSPYLVLRFEANTETQLREIQAIFRDQLLLADSTLELPF